MRLERRKVRNTNSSKRSTKFRQTSIFKTNRHWYFEFRK